MATYFLIRRSCSYLLESSNETVVIADHSPLIKIFNGKPSGSISTERIKLRYKNIRFYITCRKRQYNLADYLSRHAMSRNLLNKFENKESNDLTNL